MALRPNIPLHTVDHEPTVILSGDDAWLPRGNDELGALSPAERAEHPVARYLSGETRFDLALIAEYIDETKQPLSFVLRPLSYRQQLTIRGHGETSRHQLARSYALSVGIKRIDHAPKELRSLNLEMLTEEDLQALADYIGIEHMAYLGSCVILANQDVTVAEGKP